MFVLLRLLPLLSSLPCCLGRVVIHEVDLISDTGAGLSMLQVQAHSVLTGSRQQTSTPSVLHRHGMLVNSSHRKRKKAPYKFFGSGFCSLDEVDGGHRISEWTFGQTKEQAEAACDAHLSCQGYHWNVQDSSYVLVKEVGPTLGMETDKGDQCYQKQQARYSVQNFGQDCWDSCNSQQGPCDFCGSGYCCRLAWHDTSNGCDGEMGITGRGHVCVADPKAEPRGAFQPHATKFRRLEQEGAKRGLEDGIAVIVPGFGDEQRAELVKKNIRWLQSEGVPFDCTIYVYRTVAEFPLVEQEYAPCKLIRHPGHWMDHLKAFPLNETRRRWVLHLMDSIDPLGVDLPRMINIMNANGLAHASPSFSESYDRYPIMASQGASVGRFVSFIELQLDMFSREYFACLQDLVSDENGMGWGMDYVLPSLCEGSIGIIDEMNMVKRYQGSYAWDEAVRRMEVFLKELAAKYPGLDFVDRDSSYAQLVKPEPRTQAVEQADQARLDYLIKRYEDLLVRQAFPIQVKGEGEFGDHSTEANQQNDGQLIHKSGSVRQPSFVEVAEEGELQE